MNKLIAELFGTFCLVFAGTGAIIINDVSQGVVTHVGIAITFGLVVMAMIYAIGETSGAHINPAVTLAFAVSKRFPLRMTVPYIAAQCTGAFLASIVLRFLFQSHETLGATIPAGSGGDIQSFVLELILTLILMFVILSISQGSKEVGLMAGIAVGGVVGLEAMFAGPICGASMNPARSLAPAIVSGHVESLWVYLAAPIVGATIAAPLWAVTRKR